jgi:predicted site-specific integrase-resolvase
MKSYTPDVPDTATSHIPTFNPLLTTEQAAKFLQISPSCLERYRSTGEVKIPVVRIGDRLCRYRLSDLVSFVENNTVSA